MSPVPAAAYILRSCSCALSNVLRTVRMSCTLLLLRGVSSSASCTCRGSRGDRASQFHAPTAQSSSCRHPVGDRQAVILLHESAATPAGRLTATCPGPLWRNCRGAALFPGGGGSGETTVPFAPEPTPAGEARHPRLPSPNLNSIPLAATPTKRHMPALPRNSKRLLLLLRRGGGVLV